ncbi:FHA domain-containing protein [Agromyces sp. MMS24-JH15]|uniref:FHA domain-containing protein n=1 Tax=Agromyces sp. MMS24-JH15 TaxID=3243765 RepID=UPI003749563C
MRHFSYAGIGDPAADRVIEGSDHGSHCRGGRAMNADASGVWRGFIVEAGGAVNSIIPIPTRTATVGSDPSVDVPLPYTGVSRQHLRLDGTGPVVQVTDLQSTNGTWINDRREARAALQDGDRLSLGSVRLRFFDTTAPRPSGAPSTGGLPFAPTVPGGGGGGGGAGGTDRHEITQDRNKVGGDQHNVAGDQHNIAGSQHNIGRDAFFAGGNQHWDQRVNISADLDPSEELFNGEGPGRWIAILGGLIALGGFAWFGIQIFGAITSMGASGPGGSSGPPPALGYAFGIFAVGTVLYGIGASMSKARRKRNSG